jgi:prephenate dehydrogenase
MALRRNAGIRVVGFDPDEATADAAVECGAVDDIAGTPAGAVQGVQLVVTAAPVEKIPDLLREIAPATAADTIVTDVGSTKRRIVEEGEKLLGSRFIGGHPMAGAEDRSMASPDLFVEARWILTPTPDTSPDAIRLMESTIHALDALPVFANPTDHDRWVAYISHLPHLAAWAVSASAGNSLEEAGRSIAASSFRDTTRVARSDPGLWSGILIENGKSVLAALDGAEAWLAQVRTAIEEQDRDTLRLLLANARDARQRFFL